MVVRRRVRALLRACASRRLSRLLNPRSSVARAGGRAGRSSQGVVALDQVADQHLKSLRRRGTHLQHPNPRSTPGSCRCRAAWPARSCAPSAGAPIARRGRLAVHRQEPARRIGCAIPTGILAVGLDRHRLQARRRMCASPAARPGSRHRSPAKTPTATARTRLEAESAPSPRPARRTKQPRPPGSLGTLASRDKRWSLKTTRTEVKTAVLLHEFGAPNGMTTPFQ